MMILVRAFAIAAALAVAAPVGAAGGSEHRIFLKSNGTLGDAIDAINRQSKAHIVLHRDVKATSPMSLSLDGVSLDEALVAIAESQDLLAHRDADGTIYLGPCAAFLKAYDNSSLAAEPRRARLLVLHGDATEIVDQLKPEMPPCSLMTLDKRSGTIFITGSAATVARAERLFHAFDSPQEDDSARIGLTNLTASEAVDELKGRVPEGAVLALDDAHALLVTGPVALRDRVRRLIALIDVERTAAWFAIKVVDYTPLNDTTHTGFVWGGKDLSGNPVSGQTTTAFINRALPVTLTINDVIARTNSSLLTSADVFAKNAKETDYNVVDVQSYGITDLRTGSATRQDVSAGLKLKITPRIYNEARANAKIDLEYSDFTGSTSVFPTRTVRQLVVEKDLNDGETVVLSGLFRDVTSETVTAIPGLGRLPILGAFFRDKQTSKTKNQVVVLITMHLVRASDGVQASFPGGLVDGTGKGHR